MNNGLRQFLSHAPLVGNFVSSPDELLNQEYKKAEIEKAKQAILASQQEAGYKQAELEKAKQEGLSKYLENRPATDVFSTPKTKSMLSQTFSQDVPLSDIISGNLDSRQTGIDAAKSQALTDQAQYGDATVGQYKDMAGSVKDLAAASLSNVKETPKPEYYVNINNPKDISTTAKPGYVPSEVYSRIKQTGDPNKEGNHQDTLESQAIARIAGIRGDASLARIETQRDASIQAFNTIKNIKNENRLPSQIEYYDILGQLWKARTGASPTDQALKDLDAKTFKGNLGKAVQYFTGKPAGITTQDILNNVQLFADQTGKQSDELHAGYMTSHLIKPTGLDEERWQNILKGQRGLTYNEATQGTSQQQDSTGFSIGQQYKMKDGNMATYKGQGVFE